MKKFLKILIIIVIAAAAAVVGVIFCQSLHYFHKGFARLISNGYLRIFIGAVIVVLLSVLIGSNDYNGSSAEGITRIFETGNVRFEAFALKLLLTVITMGCGFKGGEIVPTFCIGATFGGLVGMLLGLDVGFAAALGLIGLFCSTTNSPLASIVLSVEMFGSVNLPLFALMCVITFVLSGRSGLYASQIFKFPKLSEVEKNTEQDGESNEE